MPAIARSLVAVPLLGILLPLPALARPQATNAEQAADAAVKAMTQDEKLSLLHGFMPMMIAPNRRPADAIIGAGYIPGVPRLGIPSQRETDASLGVANGLGMRKGDVATALPSGMALAATWDPALLEAGGRMIGAEARAKGFNVMLAGGVNLVRDPRAGRNFEYLGEDPLLAGRLVAAEIRGVQSNHIISTIKHFALNDQETGRATADVAFDEAAMRESDLLAFRIGVTEGKPGAVMCSYNKVGGTYACENSVLLNDILRRDWGFRGYVMSDWGAVHSTGALHAGLDQQSGEQIDQRRYLSTDLVSALAAGRASMGDVDRAARRIVWAIREHRLDPAPPALIPIDYAAHAEVALAAERAAIVLMKNAGKLLPLSPQTRTILVVGGHGDLGVPIGGGSSAVVPVGGLAKAEPVHEGAAAMFARRAWGGTSPLEGLRAAFPAAQVQFLDGSDPAQAEVAAKSADAVIVLAEKFSTEANDSHDIALGDGQDSLIERIASANPRTVVVLETGNAVAMPWLDKVPAVLSAWYGGQRGGTAIGEVIAGQINPSGRLPVTFPRDTAQLPNPALPGSDMPPAGAHERALYGVNANSPPFTIHYPERADAGYRWFDRTHAQPLFAFGSGLTYSDFRYDHLTVSGGARLTIRFAVTNIGTRKGIDVPQVYVTRSGVARRLVAWARPELAPGETRVITLTADPRVLSEFDGTHRRWITPPGRVLVELSRSVADPVLHASTRLTKATYRP